VPPAAAAAAAAAAEEATGAFAPCCVHAAAAAAASPAPTPAAAVWERRPLYCVAVPGEAVVAGGEEGEEKQQKASVAAAPSAAAKRGRSDDGDDGGDDAEMEENAAAAENEVPSADAADKKTKKEGDAKKETEKKEGSDAADGKPPAPRALPARAGDAMVFFYPPSPSSPSSSNSFSPKLNDVVEVWGVLSRVPELAAAHLDAEAAANGDPSSSSWPVASELAAHPPTSAVPRVHALFVRKVDRHPQLAALAEENGFIAAAAAAAGEKKASSPAAANNNERALAARAAALARLRRALRGDALAAEYLLLQLVSRVHLRTAGMALGTLALNVSDCPKGGGEGGEEKKGNTLKGAPNSSSNSSTSSTSPPLSDFASSVADALAALAPRSVSLPLSLRALNFTRLRPGRCPATGRLAQAPLQLAPGTQVLVDETLLEPGALSALGRDSVDALRGLLADRAVEYDFGERGCF